jgi:hypothetical protein
MGHYLVRYRVGKNKEYVYPTSVQGVAWKSTVYHYTKREMVGETEEAVKAGGKDVVSLKPEEAKRVVKEFAASYPKPEGFPEELLLPRRPTEQGTRGSRRR